MITPPQAAIATLDCVKSNIERKFREFMRRSASSRYLISADFSLSDPKRSNDVFAFTIFPGANDLNVTVDEIKSVATRDLKKVKYVPDDLLVYLASKDRFHFVFIPDSNRRKSEKRVILQELIENTLAVMQSYDYERRVPKLMQKLEGLRQHAKRNSTSPHLISDTLLCAAFCAVISYMLIKHSRPEVITWLPDRDPMIDLQDGIIFDFWASNTNNLCNENKFVSSSTSTVVIKPGDPKSQYWFDHFTRIPDHFAGAFANWDMRRNLVRPEHSKHLQIIEKSIADHPALATVLIKLDVFGVRASSLVSAREADSLLLQGRPNDLASEISYLAETLMLPTEHRLGSFRSILQSSIKRSPAMCDLRSRGVQSGWSLQNNL